MKNMFHYAKGIRRLQRTCGTSVSEFPQFGLVGRITTAEEEEQNLPGLGYTQPQNEIENYEIQEQEDPFRIQRKPITMGTRGIFQTNTTRFLRSWIS